MIVLRRSLSFTTNPSPSIIMKFHHNDGGREAAGYKGHAGDCCCRAIAIASGRPYKEIYDGLNKAARSERIGSRKRGVSSARDGVYTATARRYIESIGGVWTHTMAIGSGCTVHLRDEEIPDGRHVIALSKHYTAVIDGVIHDTYDPSREGNRCVYGYYTFPDLHKTQDPEEFTCPKPIPIPPNPARPDLSPEDRRRLIHALRVTAERASLTFTECMRLGFTAGMKEAHDMQVDLERLASGLESGRIEVREIPY
jgi:hypothetical protein